MISFKASALSPRLASAFTRSAIALGFSLAVSTLSSSAFASCSYTVVNQWGNGFQAAIKITNSGTTAINSWDVNWRYAGDNRVGGSWNVGLSGGNPYTAKNVSWNGAIKPGQTVEFGFTGTKGSARAEIPTINGAACSGTSVVSSTSSSVASVPRSSSSVAVSPSSIPRSSAPSSVPVLRSSVSSSSLQGSYSPSVPSSVPALRSSVPSSIASSVVSSSVASSSAVSSSIASSKSSSVASMGYVGDAVRGAITWGESTAACTGCHSVNPNGTAGTGSKLIDPKNLHKTTVADLARYIEANMPAGKPLNCVGQCAADTAAYILSWKPASSSSSVMSSSSIASSTISVVSSSARSSSSQVALNGAVLFADKCVACHGPEGKGPKRPIDLTKFTRASLIDVIDKEMPADNPADCVGDCAIAIADYLLTLRPVLSCNTGDDVIAPRLRVLTNYEYANTINDLLVTTQGASVAAGFVADTRVKVFNNDVAASKILGDRMNAYWSAAEQLAATANLASLGVCAASVPRDQCANTFVPTFGKKAFRRPLISEEQTSYVDLFKLGATNDAGARLVIQAMLASPNFLYRSEIGDRITGKLTAYEAASLLSYTFIGSMPDAILLVEADNNRLTTSAQLRAQAERLLAMPKAGTQLSRFGLQWLKIDDVAHLERDPVIFPQFTPTMGAAMQSEADAFLKEIFLQSGHGMSDLFNPGFTFVNAPLANYYGISGVTGDQFQKVTTNAERGGVLQLGAITAGLSSLKEGHPIFRGLMVRRNLLCQEFGAPPAVIGEVGSIDPNKATRERFAEHTKNLACASCHQYIDKIGFGFENYDAVGRYRTTEGNALTVDASGDISGLLVMTDSDRYNFSNLRGLSSVLANQGLEATSKCVTTQYQRFATGMSVPNQCAVNASYSRWQAKSTDLREMMLETVTSPTYLIRK